MIGHNISTSLAFKYYYIKIYSNLISFSKAVFLALIIPFSAKFSMMWPALLSITFRFLWDIYGRSSVVRKLFTLWGPPRESIIATNNYFYFLINGVLRLSNQNIEHLFNILLTIKLSKSFLNSKSTCSKLGIHCKIPLTPSIVLGICAAIRNPVDGTTMAT